METKSLIETNPYLKDPTIREKLVARSVLTSGRAEGIIIKLNKANIPEIPRRKDKKIYSSFRQTAVAK